MECNKWQVEGLLYVAHEMDAKQALEYGEHVQLCKVCKDEIDGYYHDKKSFFTEELLGESPSINTDAKIIAACSRIPKISQGNMLFSTVWFKRALISTVFLIFGTGAGVYFTVNYYNGISNSNAIASNKIDKPAEISSVDVNTAKNKIQSLAIKKDSLKQKSVDPFINQLRPNASSQGIITVDLKKE